MSSFSISYDDADFKKKMSELIDSISPFMINTWAKRIELDARSSSGRDIRLEVPDPKTASFSIKCLPSDIPILEKSFEKLKPAMPDITAKFFSRALKAYKERFPDPHLC